MRRNYAAADHQAHVAATMSEAVLQERVRELCGYLGLLYFHVYDSRRCPRGFPDVVVVGPRGVLYAELKREREKPTPKQREWLWALAAAGQWVYVWRPRQWLDGSVERELRRVVVEVEEHRG